MRHRLLDALALFATVLAVAALYLPASDEPPPLPWQRYSLESLRAATHAGKPAVVEVGATWCAPCVAMERTTFRDPAVVAHARGFALLKADVTAMTAAESERLSRLNVAAVPTIILFDRAGREVRRLVGYTSHTALVRTLQEVASIDTARARPLPPPHVPLWAQRPLATSEGQSLGSAARAACTTLSGSSRCL